MHHREQAGAMAEQKRIIRVVAAIIERDGSILATQRGYGEFEGGWEFPGGKVEPNETPEEAIVREIHEELNVDIAVKRHLVTVEHDYETFHLSMRCYVCSLLEDHITLLEHHAAKWLDSEKINSVNWLPADMKVVDAILEAGLVS